MDARRLIWTAIVLVLLGLAVAGPMQMLRAQADKEKEKASAEESPAGGAEVRMAGLAFSPARLAVRRGAAVTFRNDDVAPHTVTADSGAPDSGTIPPGRTFTLVIREPLEYHCEIHPAMRAEVVFSG